MLLRLAAGPGVLDRGAAGQCDPADAQHAARGGAGGPPGRVTGPAAHAPALARHGPAAEAAAVAGACQVISDSAVSAGSWGRLFGRRRDHVPPLKKT